MKGLEDHSYDFAFTLMELESHYSFGEEETHDLTFVVILSV